MKHWRLILACLAFALFMAFCGHEVKSERERTENFMRGEEYPWTGERR